MEGVKISFDTEHRVRVLDEASFKRSEELEKECSGFLDKIGTFGDKVNALVEVLEAHAQRIDAQKLKAIGLRMAAENEAEQRQKQELVVSWHSKHGACATGRQAGFIGLRAASCILLSACWRRIAAMH